LVLVHRADGTIAGVGKGTGGKDSVGRVCDGKRRPIDVHKVDSSTFGLFLVLFLVLLALAHYESIVVAPLGFLRVAVDDPGDLLIEDAVVDVGLLGVEVFVE
jgi:hypothetical protein